MPRCMSAACAARRLLVPSSISACLRCARATSRRSGSTSPRSSIRCTSGCASTACSCSFPPTCPARTSSPTTPTSRRTPTPGSRTRSGTPTTMTERLGLTAGSLVTEVASNDGYLLQHFQAAGIPVLGVEPAANVAEAARAQGIPTEVQFLGAETGARDRRRARPGRPGRREQRLRPRAGHPGLRGRAARAGQGRRAWSRWSSRTCSG